jgi:putative transposase
VADFTYVATWSGTVYVAFVIDAYSRRILGWRAETTMRTELVLDALELAIWSHGRQGVTDPSGLVHHTDAGSQYAAIAFTERLAAAGAAPSVRSVGNAYGNTLAETEIGLFKIEVIHPRGPWKGHGDVELAVLEWVDWHNHRRLHTACYDLPPAEYEQSLRTCRGGAPSTTRAVIFRHVVREALAPPRVRRHTTGPAPAQRGAPASSSDVDRRRTRRVT